MIIDDDIFLTETGLVICRYCNGLGYITSKISNKNSIKNNISHVTCQCSKCNTIGYMYWDNFLSSCGWNKIKTKELRFIWSYRDYPANYITLQFKYDATKFIKDMKGIS